MSRLLACLLGLMLLWAPPLAAQGKDDPAGMGPLAAMLLKGRDGDWSGAIDKGSYRLENRGREAGLRYFFTDPDPAAGRTAKVTVAVEGDRATSQAGLLYGYHAEPRRYFLYALTGDGSAVLLYRDGTTVRRLWSLRDGDTQARKGELGLVERGGVFELLLGGRPVGRVEHPAIGAGGVGVFAAGRGVARFSGFAIDAMPVQSAAEPVAPPPLPAGFGLGAFGLP